MMSGQRTLTIRFIGDSKNMSRAVKDIVSGLDDTESAGKRVAGAMKQLAGDAEASFRDSRDAADRLAAALGPEMVSKIEAGGRSVDSYITELQRMGLTFDDIRTDVDELADAIRRVDTTRSSIDGLKAPLKDVDGNLREVRDSADQSRSVLANLVGNSAQDLGQLGGVAGTAGVAIGQLAEYAVDGNISLSGLAKFAVPMAALGGGIALVTSNMAKNRAQAKANREQVDLFAAALAEGATAAESFRTALGGGEDEPPKLELFIGDDVRDMVPVLARAGITYEQFVTKVRELDATFGSGDPAFSNWVASMVGPGEDMNSILRFGSQLATNYGDGLTYAEQQAFVFTETQKSATEALVGTNAEMPTYEQWIGKVNTALEESEQAHERQKKAQDNAREAAQKRLETERELYGFLLSQVDANRAYEVAVDQGEDAIRSFDEVLGESKSTLEEIDDAARNSADQLIAQADAFAKSKGAADGSKESVRLQIEELYRLASTMDPNSPLRSRLIGYIGELQRIPPTIDTMLRLRISQGAVTTKDGDIIGQRAVPGGGIVAGATGGIVTRPTMSLIGEAGPEAVIPLDSLPGNFPLSSLGSGALGALGGTGGGNVTNIYITQVVPPVVDKGAVGREVHEALLAFERESGPLAISTRR
jgi:hypothetical protein